MEYSKGRGSTRVQYQVRPQLTATRACSALSFEGVVPRLFSLLSKDKNDAQLGSLLSHISTLSWTARIFIIFCILFGACPLQGSHKL
jgi:hypothetical protein